MITFVEGTIVERQPTRAVIECGGIGYDITIPLSTFDRLPDEGQTARVLTRLIIREDAHLLFGFASHEERALFDLLLEVSRVGPKLAVAVLSGLQVNQIRQAIAFQDAAMLATVSGLGKKTAERIVVELKDKIDQRITSTTGKPVSGAAGGAMLDESVAALVALGYSRPEAQQAVSDILKAPDKPRTTEDVVRAVLSMAAVT
ncbi:MAG: Holliday junction branch migration protein RuvA [candidate division Zixibacteria bacterium]|nr:Holliday junction branch migration protein RuvA [candidate division Zixibacteria bacterium]